MTAQSAAADDEAASPTASARHPAWTWGPVAPTLVLLGGGKKLIRAHRRVSTNCEIVWSECGAAVGERIWGAKSILPWIQSPLNSFSLGGEGTRKQRGDVLLVPQCLSGAEPVPSRGKISVYPSLPWVGFLFPGTGGGSVVVACCPNAGDAFGDHLGLMGEMPEQGLQLCKPNWGSKWDFPSLPPLKASQSDSSKLCALPHVPLHLFPLFPRFVPFPWGGRCSTISCCCIHPIHGVHPGCGLGTPSTIDD